MTAEHAEHDLLRRLLAGELDAFDAIYRMYFHPVYCNAIKITRDAVAAEDIVQEVFITLWEKKQSIDISKSVGGWLFVLCYNQSITHLRKSLRTSIALEQFESTAAVNPEDNNLVELQWGILENAIAQLSPQKRKVFELCKLQGKTYEETAAALQISKHTVKEYLSAAIAVLKDHAQRHPESTIAAGTILLFAVIF